MPDREYFNDRRKKRRLKFIDLLGGKCERCGAADNLHFDHKRPGKKEFRIADKIDAPEDLLMAEVKKCRLLCPNCHRDKTRERGEHGQPKSRHGTLHMYKRYGCRCDKCKERMSEYNKERRMMSAAELEAMVDEFIKSAQENTPNMEARALHKRTFDILHELAQLEKEAGKPVQDKILELARALADLGRTL